MTKVIAEIGINFGGNLSVAKDLIKQAHNAGCWGVKFQFRNPENFYFIDNEIGDAMVRSEILKNHLSFNEIRDLHEFSNKLNLKFGMSFFREEDLEFYIKNLKDADFYKVPSAECMNVKLINSLLERKRFLLVSTGGHHVENITQLLQDKKFKDVIIMHCIANYPADLGTQNLSKIIKISKTHEPGYSSHDTDFEVCFLAMASGAKWIERHLTNDKNGSGLDDSSSSNFEEMSLICKFANSLDQIYGLQNAPPNQGEILNMQNLGTGLYTKNKMDKGKKVSLSDFIIAAPRKGISVGEFINNYENEVIQRNLGQGVPLTKSGFLKPLAKLSEKKLLKAKKMKIAIPVRIHDLNEMREFIGTGCYEFHLSYDEVLSDDIERVIEDCNDDEIYSIHLPDYIPGNRIFDPISLDEDIRKVSKKVLERTENLSYNLEQKTGRIVPIVGSFSQRNKEHEDFFIELKSEVIDCSNQSIYPQWLPVKAWYFGGTMKLDVFNSEMYIKLIEKYNLKICLDVCHVILSANSHNADYKDWLNRLIPFAGHYHLAEAIGDDDEGLQLGTGLAVDYNRMLSEEQMKVIEVWQGHFDEGYGFKQALNYLINNGD